MVAEQLAYIKMKKLRHCQRMHKYIVKTIRHKISQWCRMRHLNVQIYKYSLILRRTRWEFTASSDHLALFVFCFTILEYVMLGLSAIIYLFTLNNCKRKWK